MARSAFPAVDTRALTRRIRQMGARQCGDCPCAGSQSSDIPALLERAKGLAGAGGHGPRQAGHPRQARGLGGRPTGRSAKAMAARPSMPRNRKMPHVVAIDYGAKDNIFRNLVKSGRAGGRW